MTITMSIHIIINIINIIVIIVTIVIVIIVGIAIISFMIIVIVLLIVAAQGSIQLVYLSVFFLCAHIGVSAQTSRIRRGYGVWRSVPSRWCHALARSWTSAAAGRLPYAGRFPCAAVLWDVWMHTVSATKTTCAVYVVPISTLRSLRRRRARVSGWTTVECTGDVDNRGMPMGGVLRCISPYFIKCATSWYGTYRYATT